MNELPPGWTEEPTLQDGAVFRVRLNGPCGQYSEGYGATPELAKTRALETLRAVSKSVPL